MVVKKQDFFTGVLGFWGFGVLAKLRNSGQMKIMQMSFMIIGVFFFFVMVGLFFLAIVFSDVKGNAEELARGEAISSLETIAGISELNYAGFDSMALDEDKLRFLSSGFGESMSDFWPVASIEVYKVYPAFARVVRCPASNCNYYEVYNSGQKSTEKVSAYVSICERVKEFGSVYDKCEIGKIVVGMKILEESG